MKPDHHCDDTDYTTYNTVNPPVIAWNIEIIIMTDQIDVHEEKYELDKNDSSYADLDENIDIQILDSADTGDEHIPQHDVHEDLLSRIKLRTTRITESLITLINESQETQTRLKTLEDDITTLKKDSPTRKIYKPNYHNPQSPENDNYESDDSEEHFPMLNTMNNSPQMKHINMKIKLPEFDEKYDLYEFLDSFRIHCEINQ